jgi:hypothetical protein
MMKNLHELKLPDASYENHQFKFKKRLRGFTLFTLTLMMMFFSLVASASHFRHGNMSWRVVSGRTIEFKITQAWRRSYYSQNLGINAVVGTTVNGIDNVNFGDGTSSSFNLNVTAVNLAEDFFYGEATITKTYNSDGNFTAFFSSCCKVSNLQNNANAYWRVETVVTVGNNNNSPISKLPATVNLATNQTNATFTVPVADPDGDVLTFRLATYAEMLGNNPADFSIDPVTGVATFNTVGKSAGQLWNAAIAVTDSKGAKTVVDFLIKITQQSIPPTFNYTVTPNNGQLFQTSPGQNVSFSINAADSDPGDLVTLQAVGVPPGAALTPGLPLTSNPVQSNFSWTPSNSNLGTSVINFIAQDAQGVQTTTSVTIQVSLKPAFNVPPTPVANSYTFVTAGQAISQNIQISDPDPNDKVQLVSVTGLPAGASFSTILPGTASNPYSNTLNWTPVVSQWGVNTIVLTARDTYGDQTNHTFGYVVNSKPSFTSTQSSTSVVAGQLFTYNITSLDLDIPFGDKLDILSQQPLPSWLILTDNGNGTATLSGTPQVADAGTFSVILALEDLFHHNGGTDIQSFNITVIPCNTTLSASIIDVLCAGSNNGSINLTVNGGTAPFSYAWSNGATSEDLTGVLAGNYSVIVTDANNCTESLTVTVQTTPDVTVPTVITKNISVDLANGAASITASDINNGSFDNCSIASMTIDKSSFNCSSIGNQIVTLTVTDPSGNVSTGTATVTIVGELTTSSIASVPTSGTFTGGVSTNLFLGYGAQSTTLQVSNIVSGGNGVDPRTYTYAWTGAGLSSTNSAVPVFTPTIAGNYTFSVIVTNKYGCTTSATISICVKDIREVDKKGKFTGKVFICHAPPGNPSNNNTLSISVNAVASHLSQHSDDRLGSCSDAPCTAPSNMMMSTNSTGGSVSAPTKVAATEFNLNSTEMVAYPNPFTQQTTVRFTLPYQEDHATLDIYDLKGVKIQTLFNGNANAQTTYEVQFNGQNLSAGTYFFRLITAKEVKSFKVVMNTN